MSGLHVTVVGGGMITQDQLLPSLYQLQRQGVVSDLAICAINGRPLQALADSEVLTRAFPGQSFRAFPALSGDLDQRHPDLYRSVLESMPARNLVVVALPDQMHFEAIMAALWANQHVLTVKPLVLSAQQAHEIEREALERGLLVAIEYHKRFDDRSLMARDRWRQGLFGELKLGTARLFEKWYYRDSNFQNWCTAENSDAFTYVGCHYVDLVHFITGLLPVSVSVYGIRDKYPNGNEGFLWTDARVIWNNGACLSVQNALGYPDDAPGSNTQGLTLYGSGGGKGSLIDHSDQYRGVAHSYVTKPSGAGATVFSEPSPDYLQYVNLGSAGLVPVGYGYRSIDFIVRSVVGLEEACRGLSPEASLAKRREQIRTIDQTGLIATPANSFYNEQVIEAGRESILNGGQTVMIPAGTR